MFGRAVMMVDASVDYLRLTNRVAENAATTSAYERTLEANAIATVEGIPTMESWDWMGYCGKRMGRSAYGYKDSGGYIYQATGIAAAVTNYIHLEYTQVPRLDLQVTVWLEGEDSEVARKVADRTAAYRVQCHGRPYRVRLIDGYGSGDTCYIGSRGKRSKFLRCYDKYMESDQHPSYLNAWRFECELTDNHALYAYEALREQSWSYESIWEMVYVYWRERGIVLPPVKGARRYEASKFMKDIGSDERRLIWLAEQVRPAIDKMLARGVSYKSVLTALGVNPELPETGEV